MDCHKYSAAVVADSALLVGAGVRHLVGVVRLADAGPRPAVAALIPAVCLDTVGLPDFSGQHSPDSERAD